MEVLRVRVCSKLPREQPVTASGPSFSPSSRKPVNPSPCIRSPIIRFSPHSPYPLVPSLEFEFSQGIFRSEVPGFGEQSLATHNPEVLRQRLQLRVLRNCVYDGFERDWHGSSHIFCPCFRHFVSYTQPLSKLRNLSLLCFSPANCYGVLASQLPVTQNCGVQAIQLLVAQEKQPHHSFSQQCFLLQKSAEEKEGTLKYPSSIFLPLFPFTLTETVYQPFFP